MKDDAILEAALKRMDEAKNADQQNRDRAFDDLQKVNGLNHWPDDIRTERETAGKPCLTMNQLPQFVRQVTGDIRRMNPAIKVFASDNEATEEVAEIYEGLIRHIEQRSDASSVYEQTAESAAACSMGFFRVRTEWEREDSFDQEIRIERILNPFSVYLDPKATSATREDAEYAFITETMRLSDFEDAYPDAAPIEADYDGRTDGMLHWRQGEKIVVAEYFWKEPVERTLLLLQDGSTLFEDEARKDMPPEVVIRKRKVQTHKVMWAKISGSEVLEGPQEIPCKYIPVVAVMGEEWHVGEEIYRSSVIRFAKDAQQVLNFAWSGAVEIATMQPKAPFIGTLQQFKGLETYWQNANNANYAFLPYNPDDRAPGAPQRQQPPVASQAFAQMATEAVGAMRATTGIYDAALGERSNETSGVAIRQRQMESDVSTSIYSDNMAKAIAHCGRILISMIPRVYDTNRIVRILGEDEQEQQVEINGMMVQDGQPMPIRDLSIGSYDIRVSVGPNYATRRQETAQGMMEFIRNVPNAAQLIGDLIAKAMDWPDADKIAERLQKVLPPGVREPDDLSPEEQQAAQAAMMQQQQAAQMMQQAQMIEMRKAMAEGVEAEADATKAQFEAEEQRLQVLEKSGALNAMVQQEVQRQIAALVMASRPMAQPGTF